MRQVEQGLQKLIVIWGLQLVSASNREYPREGSPSKDYMGWRRSWTLKM